MPNNGVLHLTRRTRKVQIIKMQKLERLDPGLNLSVLMELPEVFSSMKKHLFCGALREGGPLLELLGLRFVSLSSETSRSFQTSQSSQSSITSHPAFPDVDGQYL